MPTVQSLSKTVALAEIAAERELEVLFDLSGPPGYYNAAANAALLRRGNRGPHDELFVDFLERDIRIALRAAGSPLVDGPWGWQTTIQGEELTAVGEWEETCWHRDKECDYLEIELRVTGGWRLERQML